MARSRSSYTASPTRYRSPRRSPVRQPHSEEGSQYEFDLSALGMGSGIDSSALDGIHAPQIDVVDTSDIDGPEDFTMNMTYWMTADLSSQLKSRKEAKTFVNEVRGDVHEEVEAKQLNEPEGDRAIIEGSSEESNISGQFNSASPTMRGIGNVDSSKDDDIQPDTSIENDEKVISYLSALPDTDLQGAITSTPMRSQNTKNLQVPNPANTRHRSLQASVEDYDTPRKPTQETVIHHPPSPSAIIDTSMQDALREQIAQLQSRLEQQDRASKKRITELETILSYTRSELETSRTDNYKYKEQIAGLARDNKDHAKCREASKTDIAAMVQSKEHELETKMHEFGEELRLQHMAKLQNQREGYERVMNESKEEKRVLDKQLGERDQSIERLQLEISELRLSQAEEVKTKAAAANAQQRDLNDKPPIQQCALDQQISLLQAQAENLRSELTKATREAQFARQEAETAREEARIAGASPTTADMGRDTSLTCIRDLEARVEKLEAQLDASRAELNKKDQQLMHHFQEQEKQDRDLNSAQGRVESLENTLTILRQQASDAHRMQSKATADIERLEQDREVSAEQLGEARLEADRRVADVERKLNRMKELKADVEARFRDLRSEHDDQQEDFEARMEDARSHAEDAVRKTGALLETERRDKKRLAKELKVAQKEIDRLRTEAARQEDETGSEDEISALSAHSDSKEAEIENLRTLLKRHVTTIKALKSETSTLRKKAKSVLSHTVELETLRDENIRLESTISSLNSSIASLRSDLESQKSDFAAVNQTMDERIATMLSGMLKERSRNAVGKRDEQWKQDIGKLRHERDFMGKVLMREWGKQECGVSRGEKENQLYRYQYVKRT